MMKSFFNLLLCILFFMPSLGFSALTRTCVGAAGVCAYGVKATYCTSPNNIHRCAESGVGICVGSSNNCQALVCQGVRAVGGGCFTDPFQPQVAEQGGLAAPGTTYGPPLQYEPDPDDCVTNGSGEQECKTQSWCGGDGTSFCRSGSVYSCSGGNTTGIGVGDSEMCYASSNSVCTPTGELCKPTLPADPKECEGNEVRIGDGCVCPGGYTAGFCNGYVVQPGTDPDGGGSGDGSGDGDSGDGDNGGGGSSGGGGSDGGTGFGDGGGDGSGSGGGGSSGGGDSGNGNSECDPETEDCVDDPLECDPETEDCSLPCDPTKQECTGNGNGDGNGSGGNVGDPSCTGDNCTLNDPDGVTNEAFNNAWFGDTFSGLLNWSPPNHGAECPVRGFNVFGLDFYFNSHCQLMTNYFPIFQVIMLVVWTIIGFYIVIRA
jgi:hypothetical protein